MLTAAQPVTEQFRTHLAEFLQMPAGDLFASDEDVWAWKLATLLDQAPPSARAQAMRVRLALEPGRDPADAT